MKKFDLAKKQIFTLMMTVFVFIALSCAEKQDATVDSDTVLFVSVGPEPKTIDPTLNSTMDGGIYIMHVFENLTIKDETTKAVGGAAESWSVGEGNLSYTFKIRDNALWSDGKPVTAHDFVYAWRRAVDPIVSAVYSSQFAIVKNAEAIVAGKMPKEELGVKALDDKTLYVELAAPATYFHEVVAHSVYAPLREDIVTANPDGWTLDTETYIGNGAFVVSEWAHDSKIVLEKNPRYWNSDKIIPDKINFVLIDEANTAMAGIRTGDLYFYNQTPANERVNLINEGLAKVVPDTAIYYYVVNTTKKPFDDTRVRRALSLAIDRQYIVDVVMKGGQIPASGVVPVNIIDGDSEFRAVGKEHFGTSESAYAQNILEAKALLAEAGYPDGVGFPVVEFKTNPGAHVILAESVQRMLKENLNIDMTIMSEEWSVFLQTRQDGNFQIARHGWTGGYNHPMAFLRILRTGEALNEGKYSSADFDAQLDIALNSQDAALRSAAMHKAEDIAMSDMAIIPIYYYTSTIMQTPKMTGVVYDVFGRHRFHHANFTK